MQAVGLAQGRSGTPEVPGWYDSILGQLYDDSWLRGRDNVLTESPVKPEVPQLHG
jgi:hypothetical protein